jgi:hypothetical protein
MNPQAISGKEAIMVRHGEKTVMNMDHERQRQEETEYAN